MGMKLNSIKQKAFTIVELLVVIVVIGILAAITIVSYSNISSRGALASEQSAANNIASKAEVYKSNTGDYPTSTSVLTALASTDPAYVPSSVFTAHAFGAASITTINGTTRPTGTAPNNWIRYFVCGIPSTGTPTAAPTTIAGITTKTGILVQYWDFVAGTVKNDVFQGLVTFSTGVGTGTYTIGGTTYNASCVAEI